MKPEPTKQKNPAAVALGRLGGAATKGIKKKNGTALARRAARIRWAKYETEMTAKIESAHAAKFPPEAEQLRAVRAFYEIRGLHRRGRIGDSMLVGSHETAQNAVAKLTPPNK